jgi:hypothetical protein
MKLVECPICDSKFDIEKVPEGTKLKCGKCQKVFGVVRSGEMIPVMDAQKPAPESLPEESPAESQTVRRPSTVQPMRASQIKRSSQIKEPPKPKPKPEPLLYVGSLVAFLAIGMFFYVFSLVQKPAQAGDKPAGKKSDAAQPKDTEKATEENKSPEPAKDNPTDTLKEENKPAEENKTPEEEPKTE